MTRDPRGRARGRPQRRRRGLDGQTLIGDGGGWPDPNHHADASTALAGVNWARGRRFIGVVVTLTSLGLLAVTPDQARAQAGWYLTPSLRLTEEFDDNIFGRSSGRTSDFVSRLSPGLTAGFQSKPLTLLTNASLDAELFAEHPELSDPANRKRAGVGLEYVPDRPTTLGLNASFAETQTPSELQPLTGVELGRKSTRQWSVAPSVVHQFRPITSGDASYSYGQSVSRGLTSTTQQGRLGLSHEFSHLGSGTAHYTLRQVDSDGGTSSTSHAITGGWSWKLQQTTAIAFEAGPRISDGAVEPDVTAKLTHRFKMAALSVGYARTETTVSGQAGTVETNSLSSSLTFTPRRSLQVSLGSLVSQTTSKQTPDTMVYNANASVVYRLTKWLNLEVMYRFSLQDQGHAQIYHNVFSIGLAATYPTRVH